LQFWERIKNSGVWQVIVFATLAMLLIIMLSVVTYFFFFRDLPQNIPSSSAMDILTPLMRINGTLLSFTIAFLAFVIRTEKHSKKEKWKKPFASVGFSILAYLYSFMTGFRLMIESTGKEYVSTFSLLIPLLAMISAVVIVLLTFFEMYIKS